MSNIWSSNKYVNITINILLFLVGVNIFHYGQLLLPIICLILFIDNKLRFVVNNKWTFVLLCLFAISFFVFAYELGFYSVMGFCLPMAYYIGSNIKNTNEENIKKIIYLVSLGMASHVMLNFVTDIKLNGMHLFSSSSHYDIWIPGKVTSTSTLTNCIPMLGILYYLVNKERTKVIKYTFLCLFLIVVIYNFGLGQRTLYAMMLISFITGYIIDSVFYKRRINIRIVSIIIGTIALLICLFVICYCNIDKFNSLINNTRIFVKFFKQGFSTNRLSIFANTIKLAPQYLFGGCKISESLGIMPHDLWLDVYNWGGIIPCILLLTHTVFFIITSIKVIRNKEISSNFKLFIIPLFICIGFECLLEPIMSGASLFLIVVIIFESLIEKLYYGK